MRKKIVDQWLRGEITYKEALGIQKNWQEEKWCIFAFFGIVVAVIITITLGILGML